MNIKKIIAKKRDCLKLEKSEIDYFIAELVAGNIPDYQITAMLMAIYINGMEPKELSHFTSAMATSGSVLDLQAIQRIKVDKHSTGGVGDKTTLIVAPMVAAAGACVAKLSGKGLAHTGGTLDKLSVFPGFRTDLSLVEFESVVSKTGLVISGQTDELVPADKILYSLRDATCTVTSLPLIASSIMSKKIAGGADAILLDVKVGSGASTRSQDQAYTLANTMIRIGKSLNRRTHAILSSMDQPLGYTVGNALEVSEAIDTLMGNGPKDVLSLSLQVGSIMLEMAGICTDRQEAIELLDTQIKTGAAMEKWAEMIEAQGGDASLLAQPEQLRRAPHQSDLKASETGFVSRMDARVIGEAAMLAGAGRKEKNDQIDLQAGVILHKKIADPVVAGETVFTILSVDPKKLHFAATHLQTAIAVSEEPIQPPVLVIDEIF